MHHLTQLLAELRPYLLALDSVLVICGRIADLTGRRSVTMATMTTPAPRALLSIDAIDNDRAALADVVRQLLDLCPTEFRGRGPGATVLRLDDAECASGAEVVIQPDQLAPLASLLAELLPDR